jgi:hypothetical protein
MNAIDDEHFQVQKGVQKGDCPLSKPCQNLHASLRGDCPLLEPLFEPRWAKRLVLPVFFMVFGVVCAAEAPPAQNAREMFRALGVEDAYFDRLADGRPLTAEEDETMLRVLFRLRMFPLANLERWAHGEDQLSESVDVMRARRGEVFRLHGRVLEVEPIVPPKDLADRYETPRCFRCRLKLDSPNALADMYTDNVPRRWRDGAKPDASAGCLGVFLKTAEPKSDPKPLFVFVAPRLAWHPNNLLGRLGMDFGLFDSVEDQQPIRPEESEAFYQMLAAAGKTQPDELLDKAEQKLPQVPAGQRWTDHEGRERYSVVPLFNEAAAQRGKLVDLLGTARRVEKILVDPDIAARFGFDHYYSVMVVTDDSQANPLTFCVLELPEGMPYGILPRYGETVRIAGFFLKTWDYAVTQMTDPTLSPGDPKTHRQLSPLLIGRSLQWEPPAKPADRSTSDVVAIVFVAAITIVFWLVTWKRPGARG